MAFRNRGREREACLLLIHKVIIRYQEMKLKESPWANIYCLKKLINFLQPDKMRGILQLNLNIIGKAI